MTDNKTDINQKIAKRLETVWEQLPDGVELCAVSKFHPQEMIRAAYKAGQRVFGESRVQELVQKHEELADLKDLRWNFIGHLQTNKLNALMKLNIDLIQSVDSERLLEMIDRKAEEEGKIQKVLLQVHVAKEETKFGFLPEEIEDYFHRRAFEKLRATHISGIMGMATNTDDVERIKDDFNRLKLLYDRIREDVEDLRGFDILSMGMSDDYHIAIECGSDMVRIGSAIFGPRNY